MRNRFLMVIAVVLCTHTASFGLIGDINGDGYVNIPDLQMLVAKWAYGPGHTGPEDINLDGYVNVGDLQQLIAYWGTAAHTFTWTGGAYVSGNEATRYWDLAGNWSPSGPPAAGQTALIDTTANYAIANADLPGLPVIEVAAGGAVAHQNGATLTMPITLSGGTWHTSPWWDPPRKYDGTWGTNRSLSGPVTVTAPSFIKGTRGATITLSGPIDGTALLTFKSDDSYGSQGPSWTISHADNPHSGGVLIEAGSYPTLSVTASQGLGTGDVTVRSTGTLAFGANQDYSGAVRTPVLYLEGGSTAMTDHLSGATIPFDVIVQSQGGTLGAGTWASGCTYSGSVTLNGPLTLAGSRAYSAVNYSISGPITGDQPVTVNTTDSYNGGRGIVALTNAGNIFASLTLQRGYLKITSEGALASGPVSLHTPDAMTRFYLDKSPDADWSIANSLAGTGTIQVETGSGCTLTTSGAVSPGINAGNVGTITVQGNLAFAVGATVTVDLNGVDLVNPAADLLAVTGTLSNLGNATLSIVPTGDISAIAGRPFTIATCANDLTGQNFANVSVPEGWDKLVTYGNGWVKVAVAPNTGNDVVAPAAVADLAAGEATLHSLTLTWTAPGDDGILGTASSYDIRYSASEITEATWADATPVPGVPAPAAAGTSQSVTVSGLTMGTAYYFAMMARDEVPNVSALSNVAAAQTEVPDSTPPAAVTNLAAGTRTSTSVTLTWTAPGDDGDTGTARTYDIRYSTTGAITEDNWALATEVPDEPAPQAAGTNQSMVITGLSASTTYYFAMKTADEVPNASGLSNVVSRTTLEAPKPLLTPRDFKYLGYYCVQRSGYENMAELQHGQSFTHRYVDGQLRFLTLSFFGNVAGGGHHLMEFAPPASGLGGTVTNRTNHWPDIMGSTGLGVGNGVWIGLWYEQSQERLWTTWAIDYTTTHSTISMVTRTLNADGTVSNVAGPWGLAGINQRRLHGGVQAIPEWFQSTYNVAPYAIGWGGYTSIMGNGVSLGPIFYAIPDPTGYPTGENGIPVSVFKTIMDHSGATTAGNWYSNGVPTSYDRGIRNCDVTNAYDNWYSPAPDGIGRWTWGDSNWNTGCWIDTPTRHGFILVPNLCSGRTWYNLPTGAYLTEERRTTEIQVFDPYMLGEAAAGTRAAWNTYPTYRWQITDDMRPQGCTGSIGATYDPITQRLYVYSKWGANLNSYVFVYEVGNDNAPVEEVAAAETTAAGTVSGWQSPGRLSSAQYIDRIYEAIQEVATGDTSQLEHKWTFSVTAGSTVTFNVKAYHNSNTEGDDFVFAYSTNGTDWTDMLTVTKTAFDGVDQTYTMPAGTGGTVYVRVRDTDRTAGNNTLDTIFVDHMFFSNGSAGNVPTAETPIIGTIGGLGYPGNRANTENMDGTCETIQEVLSSGTSQLEHKWTFHVTSGSNVTFKLKAYHSINTEGDDFVFAYSTNGTDWTDMATVTKTADDGNFQTCTMPAGTSGTVYVRVQDTDRTNGNGTLDRIYVDKMVFVSSP